MSYSYSDTMQIITNGVPVTFSGITYNVTLNTSSALLISSAIPSALDLCTCICNCTWSNTTQSTTSNVTFGPLNNGMYAIVVYNKDATCVCSAIISVTAAHLSTEIANDLFILSYVGVNGSNINCNYKALNGVVTGSPAGFYFGFQANANLLVNGLKISKIC